MTNAIDAAFWGEPISVYADADAVEDGVLVKWDDVRINRVTRALFDRFTRGMGKVMIDITPLRRLLDEVLARGKRDDGWVTLDVPAPLGGPDGCTVWLVPNEVGSLTAMLPEDY